MALPRITNARAGYATVTGPGGVQEESDTATCVHCNSVWIVRSTDKTKEELGGWCRMCQKAVCPNCADKGCTPFEKKLALMESRDRMLRSFENAG